MFSNLFLEIFTKYLYYIFKFLEISFLEISFLGKNLTKINFLKSLNKTIKKKT
jgi:hypothetical protein